MSSVTVEQMREIEQRAVSSGISEAELMQRAGRALGQALGSQYRDVGTAVAYIGKGHNAGDALIALRVLQDEYGWEIGVRVAYDVDEWAPLTKIQWDATALDRFLDSGFEKVACMPLLLIDGLLGIGAQGEPRAEIKEMTREINRLRNDRGTIVVAVDVPSGVDPDCGEIFPGAVIADRTFMIGAAKSGLLHSQAANATGQLALVEVDVLKADEAGEMELICPQNMTFGKTPRAYDFHKGKAGRVGIIAGSSSFSGAALLSVLGAIRGGAGLVTLYVRSVIHDALMTRLPYEAMLKRCDFPEQLLDKKLDAIVIGPGLGEMSQDFTYGLSKLIAQPRVPTVIDADGLNFMAQHGLKTHKLHVLTPHPGEFARLAPNLSQIDREKAAREFVKKNDAVLLLKGARSIVAKAGSPLRINSTGTPAMSNGGQGDLLSGVIGAQLAGGMDSFNAATYGAWLCGHAAELAYESFGDICTASDISTKIGEAMRSWRMGKR